MADRLEVDLLGVYRAADSCRSTGSDAGAKLSELLVGLTRGAVEAAAGRDDYGRQIIDGWAGSRAESFPEVATAIRAQLIAHGKQMGACALNAEATDNDAARQVRAADIGLEHTSEGWGPTTQSTEET